MNIIWLYYYQWTLNLEVSKNPDNRGMMKHSDRLKEIIAFSFLQAN